MDSKEFEKIVYQFLKEKPFYGNLILQMNRIFSNSIPLAGVSITSNINLYINLENFIKYSLNSQKQILEHECLHILLEHVTWREFSNPKLGNLACDGAINQFLPTVTKEIDGLITLEWFKKTLEREDILEKQNCEYYYDLLEENKDKLESILDHSNEQGKGTPRTLDSHDKWKESFDPSTIREVTKNAVANAVKNSGGIGRLSINDQRLVSEILKNKVDWRSQLRFFSKKSINSSKIKTRKRPNRRYGLLFQGKKSDNKVNLFVGIDTSGSMGPQDLSKIMAELYALALTNGVKITLSCGDSDILDISEYKKGKKINLKGGGGTRYQPFLDKAKELDCDACIIFGDMDCFDKLKNVGLKTMFCDTSCKGKNPFGFGKYVEIKD